MSQVIKLDYTDDSESVVAFSRKLRRIAKAYNPAWQRVSVLERGFDSEPISLDDYRTRLARVKQEESAQ